MSEMVCSKCGAKLDEGAKFCMQCGQLVGTPPTEQTAPTHPVAPIASSTSSSRARKLPIVPLAILGAGVLALIVVLLFMRSNPPAGEALSRSASATPTTLTLAPTPIPPPEPTPIPTPPPMRETVHHPRPTPPIVAIYYGRRGADFNVSPEDALVTVNGQTIGKADDWDNKGGGQHFFFTKPGAYYAKFTLPGYRTTWVKIVSDPMAKDEFADVDTKMPEMYH